MCWFYVGWNSVKNLMLKCVDFMLDEITLKI